MEVQINKLGAPELAIDDDFFDQRCYLNLTLIFLKINLESKSAKCVPSLSPEFLARMEVACRLSSRVGGSQFQTDVFKWGIAT